MNQKRALLFPNSITDQLWLWCYAFVTQFMVIIRIIEDSALSLQTVRPKLSLIKESASSVTALLIIMHSIFTLCIK